VVQAAHLIPLVTLLAVDRRSPYYHDESKVGMFHAESWALTHFLTFGPEMDQGKRLNVFYGVSERCISGRTLRLRNTVPEFDSFVVIRSVPTLGRVFGECTRLRAASGTQHDLATQKVITGTRRLELLRLARDRKCVAEVASTHGHARQLDIGGREFRPELERLHQSIVETGLIGCHSSYACANSRAAASSLPSPK
jgi:hypothetical protein